MKPPIKLITFIFALIILGALIIKSPMIQAQQAPVPVVINPAPRQYRVIDISQIAVANGRTASGTLEAILNEMGAQGWRVVTTSGSLVIMMQ